MRFVSALAVAALLSGPAMAQQLSPLTGTTASPPVTAAPAPGMTAPSAQPGAPAPRRQRRSVAFQQRFDTANTTHDGKLTLEQAKAGRMRQVERNFDKIDVSHKGYVTVDDIRAYRRAQRQARAAAKRAAPAN